MEVVRRLHSITGALMDTIKDGLTRRIIELVVMEQSLPKVRIDQSISRCPSSQLGGVFS